jgi:FkbM family methyltransferase
MKWATLFFVLDWVISEMPNYPVSLKFFQNKQMLVPSNDTIVGRSVSHTGTYDETEKNILLQLVKPGDTVIEVGANIGSYSVYLAERIGEEGVLIALEPFRLLHQILNANIALNGIGNVFTLNMGLCDGPARTVIADGPNLNRLDNYGASSLVDDSRKTWFLVDPVKEKVRMAPLDSLDLDINKLDFVKIDAESMEYEVLRGGKETIRKFKPVLYVENSLPDDATEQTFEDFVYKEFQYKCIRPHVLAQHNIVICSASW